MSTEHSTAHDAAHNFASLTRGWPPSCSNAKRGWIVAHRLKTIRMVAAALVGTKDSQKTPASTVGRALCSLCALGQLSISTYRLGLPVSWSKACRQATINQKIVVMIQKTRSHELEPASRTADQAVKGS